MGRPQVVNDFSVGVSPGLCVFLRCALNPSDTTYEMWAINFILRSLHSTPLPVSADVAFVLNLLYTLINIQTHFVTLFQVCVTAAVVTVAM